MNYPLVRGALIAAVLSTLAAPGFLFAWSPKQASLMTRWAKDVDPANTLPEYPRPQMVRADWLNLNGVWEFKRGAEDDALPASDAKLPEEILVPFPMESALSGVMEHSERVWYRRHFTVPTAWSGQRVLLHFGAVDFESEVFVNGQSAGVHKGGYLPFTYDVTPLLKGDGPQELVVRVFDPTDDAGEPRGKQSLHPGGIMYTPTTGIWQTVWLEPVAQNAIDTLKIVPDVDGGALKLTANAAVNESKPWTVRVSVKDGDQVVADFDGKPGAEMSIPVPNAKLWTPDSPFLYDLEVSLVDEGKIVDRVKSYFGMRKISVGDDHGVKKMLLNDKFVFEFGPLDQGFWPDGIYTAPTEAALKNDIEMMKAYGFDMVRKHIKVEPARWYYWCDKLGLMVWQDMPSGNSYINTKRYPVPTLDTAEFDSELTQMVRALWNTPSIIMWDLFNEHQGQHDTPQLVEKIKALDPSRLVNEASGDKRTGHGDVYDDHHYPPPVCPPPSATQAIAIGEFGGIKFAVPDHVWARGRLFGNIAVPEASDIPEKYAEFSGMIRSYRDERGLSAAVYTQLTDVENEVNGLMTYDRIPKVDPALLLVANPLEFQPVTYQTVVPTSDVAAQTWKYTTSQPAPEWSKKEFDDATWTAGSAPFGKQDQVVGNTPWNTENIWLRRHFDPGSLSADDLKHLVLRLYHDDDVEVYINGVAAYAHNGFVTGYEYDGINPPALAAIVPGGDNVLAVHCLQKTGGQYIDAGISQRLPPTK